jgi:hypothetical protein
MHLGATCEQPRAVAPSISSRQSNRASEACECASRRTALAVKKEKESLAIGSQRANF